MVRSLADRTFQLRSGLSKLAARRRGAFEGDALSDSEGASSNSMDFEVAPLVGQRYSQLFFAHGFGD